MELNQYFFVIAFLFVGVMLLLSFRKRALPPADRLRQGLSPQLRAFLDSLPLSAEHPLHDFCQPWSPTMDYGYNKQFLPLWQNAQGEPSFVRQYMKLGSPVVFCGVTNTESEQGFIAALVLGVMQRDYEADPAAAIQRGRQAAEVLGFAYFDRAVMCLTGQRRAVLDPAGETEGEDRIEDQMAVALVEEIELLERPSAAQKP